MLLLLLLLLLLLMVVPNELTVNIYLDT